MMRLVVQIITGRLFYVEVDDNATVRDLKREIGTQGRLSVSIDRLIIILVVQHHLTNHHELLENGSSGGGDGEGEGEGCCCSYLMVEEDLMMMEGQRGKGGIGTLLIECGVRDGSHIHLCFTPPPPPAPPAPHPIPSSSNAVVDVDVDQGGGDHGSHTHLSSWTSSSFFTLPDALFWYGPSSASSSS